MAWKSLSAWLATLDQWTIVATPTIVQTGKAAMTAYKSQRRARSRIV